MKEPLRVLVVDDTVIYRKIVGDVLAAMEDVEVAGVAHNGKVALARLPFLKPHLLTLDVEMPEMGGLEVLEELAGSWPDMGAIMLSSLTRRGSEMTVKALELGAFDFIPKPEGRTMEENRKAVEAALVPRVKAFARQREVRSALRRARGGAFSSPAGKPPSAGAEVRKLSKSGERAGGRSEVVAIGISTGGPNALSVLLPGMPGDLGAAVLVVQHMPPVFTQSLAQSLDAKCALRVKEASEGDVVRPNVVYIAPGGKQMKVASGGPGGRCFLRVTDDRPEKNCKPSADYLFRSVSQVYPGRATGVIMTGMGSDGTLGLRLMKRAGCPVIAQSEETCVVYGMPKEAVEAGVVDVVAPLDRLAGEIRRTVQSGRGA